MKRTNLVLNEELLKTATRILGARTYSAAVNHALEESIRISKIRQLNQFIGSNLWQGNLTEMRQDRRRRRKH